MITGRIVRTGDHHLQCRMTDRVTEGGGGRGVKLDTILGFLDAIRSSSAAQSGFMSEAKGATVTLAPASCRATLWLK